MVKGIIFDWGDTLIFSSLERYFPTEIIKNKFKIEEKTINRLMEFLTHKKVNFCPKTLREEKIFLNEFWLKLFKELNIANHNLLLSFLLEWTFKKYRLFLFPESLEVIRSLYK